MSDNIPANERPKSPMTVESSGGRSMYTPGALWGGVALIGLGTVFLLQTLGLLSWGFNWWAIFILFPGLGMLYKTYQISQETGGLDHRSRGTLIGGLAVTTVACIFLFNLPWDVMWPLFLIEAGVAFFLTAQRD